MPVYTAMSRLEAVNEILTNAGLLPVNSITSVPDVDKAVQILDNTSRQVQTEGWNFNTDRYIKISPDATAGNIILPLDCMHVDTVGPSRYIEVTQRDGVLRKTNRYDGEDPEVFTGDVYLDIVHYLDFEVIPQVARYYITVRAARRFADSYSTSNTVHRYTIEEEMFAKSALEENDLSQADHNFLENNPYTRRRSLDGGF